MTDKRQQETDKAIKDNLGTNNPLDANNPDAEVRERYWRNQYSELLKQTNHDRKERKYMDLITRLLCYTIYIANSTWMVVNLCNNDPNEPWDSTQRLLWCIVLAMNVGFGVFVLMSRLVMKVEKQWVDRYYNTAKENHRLTVELEMAEHTRDAAIEEYTKLKQKNREKTK